MSEPTPTASAQQGAFPFPYPWSAAMEAVDAVDALEVPLNALKGLEELIDIGDRDSGKDTLRNVERGHLSALIGCLVTRLHLDLAAAKTAADTASQVARAAELQPIRKVK